MKHVGLIEPLVVYPRGPGEYLLLEGHVRLDIPKSLGIAEAKCLLSTDTDRRAHSNCLERQHRIHSDETGHAQRNLPGGRISSIRKAWTRCVLRRAVSRQMQEQSRFEQLDEVEITQNWLEEDTDASTVRNLLGLLSPREEEVLLLRLEAMKYREIADRLGISMNSVNTHLARALQKLQKATAAQGPIRQGREQYENKPVKRAS